ncbi:MAG: radical SAM family heme chaperone HemW [Anaerolineales bacterium]
MQPLSIYVHIPFCRHRCGYCDFNTYAGMNHLVPAYISGLKTEIRQFKNFIPVQGNYRVQTIYFGGGTPSLIPPGDIGAVLEQIFRVFQVDEDCEITMEANPGTVSLATLNGYRQQGVNRISLGVQSSNLNELQLLEREHEFSDVQRAVADAKKAGFLNISLDLIFGIPGQNIDNWQTSLSDVVDLAPEHLSLYSLTIEEGTPFAKYVREGKMPYPDEDIAADMYDFAREFLRGKGFQQYEISNWARKDSRGDLMISRHNRQYWLNGAYIGFGAGAHGSIEGERLENEKSIVRYIRALEETESASLPATPGTKARTPIDPEREMNETMMLGLRLLVEGVSEDRFEKRFGIGMRTVFGKTINKLEAKKLVEWCGPNRDTLRLTEMGYLLGNQVFVEFV